MMFFLSMLWWQIPELFCLMQLVLYILECFSGLCVHVEVVALASCVSCLAKHYWTGFSLRHLSDSWAFGMFCQ